MTRIQKHADGWQLSNKAIFECVRAFHGAWLAESRRRRGRGNHSNGVWRMVNTNIKAQNNHLRSTGTYSFRVLSHWWRGSRRSFDRRRSHAQIM